MVRETKISPRPVKWVEYNFKVVWENQSYAVQRLHVSPTTTLDEFQQQLTNNLVLEHGLNPLDKEFAKKTLKFLFEKYGKWYPLTNIKQIETATGLKIDVLPTRYAYVMEPSIFGDPLEPTLFLNFICASTSSEYMFCNCMSYGERIICTTVSGYSFKVNLPSDSRCHNKWCNKELTSSSGRMDSTACLIIKAEYGMDVLAGFCSFKCAMEYRSETRDHMRKETLNSFRYLIRMPRGNIRIMRILRDIHDKIEELIRSQQKTLEESVQWLICQC